MGVAPGRGPRGADTKPRIPQKVKLPLARAGMLVARMTVFLVSHFHWDREWYRTMQAFRARLVDAIDQLLDLAAGDPELRFVLDGQTIVLEDYCAIRPDREPLVAEHIAAGRFAVGPWYVQPDSLLPSGESLVRNLLIGRRTARRFGACSLVAYVPDSFGHPAQLPQLFRGFGLDGFVYWRGNGAELDRLGPRWRWRAPDGSSVRALLLSAGYFAAARPDADTAVATRRTKKRSSRGPIRPDLTTSPMTRADPVIRDGVKAYSEHDEQYLRAAEVMAARLRGASRVTLAGAGHIANLDVPAAFDAALLGFLAEHGIGTGAAALAAGA